MIFTGQLGQIFALRKRWLPLVIGVSVLSTAVDGLSFAALIPLVAILYTVQLPAGMPEPLRALGESLLLESPGERFLLLAAVVLALFAFKGLLQALATIATERLMALVSKDLFDAVAVRIMALDYAVLQAERRSRLTKTMNGDCWWVITSFRAGLQVVQSLISLSVYAGLLALLDWRLFAVSFIGALFAVLFAWRVDAAQRYMSRDLNRHTELLEQRQIEIVFGARLIRIFGQREQEGRRFRAVTEGLFDRQYRISRLGALLRPGLELIGASAIVAIIFAGFFLDITIAGLTAFLVLLSRMIPLASPLSASLNVLASRDSSRREVQWLLDPELGVEEDPALYTHEAKAAAIAFDKVSYAYPDGTVALADASFALPAGSATALIGHSGAGKSTIVNILAGLVRPASGSIEIDGERLGPEAQTRLRELVAVAGQDLDLFTGTIAYNIAFGNAGASEAEILEAARLGGVTQFLDKLPNGMETEVGHLGLNLSGGQRQRVGLARALLRRPALLILDEALNAVDAISEREIVDLLNSHTHFGSALVVSHRRSTLAACAFGIAVDKGRVVEQGRLEDLHYFEQMLRPFE